MSEAKDLVIQAELMEREMDFSLDSDYKAENMPLLLHQVGVQQSSTFVFAHSCSHDFCSIGTMFDLHCVLTGFQFFVDRLHELVQCKHMHMLRWRRFCEHTSTIETLHPFFNDRLV